MFKGELASTQLRGAPSFSYCTTTAVDLARVSSEPHAAASGEAGRDRGSTRQGKGADSENVLSCIEVQLYRTFVNCDHTLHWHTVYPPQKVYSVYKKRTPERT